MAVLEALFLTFVISHSIGLANAGSAREDLAELLLPIVSDSSLSMELSAVTALALGLIFVGHYENDVPSTIIQTMMEREDVHLNDPWSRYLSLGLALLYLGMSTYYAGMILGTRTELSSHYRQAGCRRCHN